MVAFFVVVAIWNLALGYALGWHRLLGDLPGIRAASAMIGPFVPRSAPDEGPSAEFLARLQELTTHVQELAGRHKSRVSEITQGLGSQTNEQPDPSAVLAAATALIKANGQLETELAHTKHEIELQQQRLESTMVVARTDPLTNVANRRAYDGALREHFGRFQTDATPLCLFMLDVDHFKKFNDQFGHQAGDEILRGVARTLQQTMRDTDLVARYGGEEFCVLLPGATQDEAKVAAERARVAIEEARFEFEGSELRVTASVGLAWALPDELSGTLVKRADEALYEAKRNGRNRSYYHNGESCQPIDITLRESRRYAFSSRQRVAPYLNGVLPTSSKFVEVECEDLSSTGFSFLFPHKPHYDQVAVAFGSPEDPFYRIAAIRNCTQIGTPENPMFRIGCVFTDRISGEALGETPHPSESGLATAPQNAPPENALTE